MFVVIGTTTMDLFLRGAGDFSGLGADGFRASNLTFTDEPLTLCIGGNGGNSAYVLGSLGAPTALCSAVGRDPLGDMLVDWLSQRGVNLTALRREEDAATSTSTILMNSASHQVVYHHLGATQAARIDDAARKLLSEARVLLASSYPIMPRLRNGGYAQALSLARQAGAITALDVGPAIGQPVTLAEIRPLLPLLDYFIANSHELQVLTEQDGWQAAAGELQAAGAARILVKQGKEGVTLVGDGQRLHVPAFTVQEQVTAGAGDSFNAGFLYGIERGWEAERALRFGSAVAACVVATPRGVLDAPTVQQVEEFIDARR